MLAGSRLTDRDFDETYYARCCGRPYRRDPVWLDFFGGIAARVVSTISPRRALDAGCAFGFMVEQLRARGVDARGFDVSSYAMTQLPPELRAFCWTASVCDEIEGWYDLITCQEVFPHLTAEDGEAAIRNFCRHTDDVLFSSSPMDPAWWHRNGYAPEEWAEVFARCGFYRDHAYDASFITPWAVRYRRSIEPLPVIVRSYERRLHELRRERDEARGAAAARLEPELAAARQAYAQAQDRILHMERSWFWRARGVWTFLTRR